MIKNILTALLVLSLIISSTSSLYSDQLFLMKNYYMIYEGVIVEVYYLDNHIIEDDSSVDVSMLIGRIDEGYTRLVLYIQVADVNIDSFNIEYIVQIVDSKEEVIFNRSWILEVNRSNYISSIDSIYFPFIYFVDKEKFKTLFTEPWHFDAEELSISFKLEYQSPKGYMRYRDWYTYYYSTDIIQSVSTKSKTNETSPLNFSFTTNILYDYYTGIPVSTSYDLLYPFLDLGLILTASYKLVETNIELSKVPIDSLEGFMFLFTKMAYDIKYPIPGLSIIILYGPILIFLILLAVVTKYLRKILSR